ncbi:outer membrane protein, protease secretion system [Duganella sacchari]|uniref:Outer membrane protein, protease secretion system n=1 Tax=Duganella sacchari TaxID=551987 RepID=A0A1M7R910_9BURK|nr:TolC family outer membrane protein [Duganella sacchari]SHN42630.1 outer membrane protein, protease secretion system [Duganella sacchari]
MNAHFKPRRLALTAALASALMQMGSAQAMSLMQAYQAALANDATYQQALQDAEAGKEFKTIGRSNLLPNVQANYSFSHNRADQTTDYGPPLNKRTDHPEYVSRSSSLNLRQSIYNPDGWARYKQGQAQTAYAAENFEGRAQELIGRVVGAYIDALFADEQVRINTAQRDMYKEQKAVNDRLFEKGEGTKTDMLETQSRLDLAEAQLIEALDNQQTQLAMLSTMVGEEVKSLDRLMPEFRIGQSPESFETWRKIALENNPDIKAQGFGIEAARQEVAKSQAGHKPRLDFVASYSKATAETLNTNNQDSTNRTIGIQLTVPLYSGGAVSATARQSVAGLEKAKAELQLRTDKVMVELRKQYASVLSSVTRIRALEKAVSSADLLITATEQSIKGGVRINLDLLNARQQLYTSQRDLAQARYTYLVALLKLRTAAGVVSADDVREIGAYFK